PQPGDDADLHPRVHPAAARELPQGAPPCVRQKAEGRLQNGADSMNLPLVRLVAITSALCILPSAFAKSEEVAWRDDYAKARKEAADKGRPLVIDLTTEDCFWCKQLDTRTFTDPDIVGLLNGSCVPLKVDSGREPFLAQALRVQSYPTLVYA